ncbi:MAG: 7-carboxy-7-deazaguanine synthase QueE [Betaproteobacteria bacterium]|nr:7-carboxy-7-deazaguanine synthase QueE [Betaproteobacteria bacterium]
MSDGGTLTLKVSEIFFSLQGETSRSGLPTVFVRLTGCPLRCRWCDTEYAFSGGETMSLAGILERVAGYAPPPIPIGMKLPGQAPCRQPLVCVTGGEPLAQKNTLPLLRALADAGYSVSLETSGALDVSGVDARVVKILDLKAPSSGEEDKNLWDNLSLLDSGDEVKIVLADRADYEWARQIVQTRLTGPCAVLFSPVQGAAARLSPQDLAEWILADRLPVRFQLQLHKTLWGAQRGK